MEATKLKLTVANCIDSLKPELIELSLKIHDNPETGFQEFKAMGWLTAYLKGKGFAVEHNIGGLETAFKASCGKGSPVIAFIAEYDALPGLGHACGHNIIAAASLGAGIASKLAVENSSGTILVIGTPAEELHGGKIMLAEKGIFKGIDAALMVHPGTIDAGMTEALACQNLEIEFFGKAAHAAANPEDGRNALEAMIISFNGINGLRQHMKTSARIHGIITDGGKAPNVVPEYCAGRFIVRDKDDDYLDELKERTLNCFKSGALATGTKLVYKWDKTRYRALRRNVTIADLYRSNMTSLGRQTLLEDTSNSLGSTDMGNVSQLVPAIHASLAIAPVGISTHSKEFAQAAASETGMQGMIDAAKALAMTAVDLIAAPELVAKAAKEFVQNG